MCYTDAGGSLASVTLLQKLPIKIGNIAPLVEKSMFWVCSIRKPVICTGWGLSKKKEEEEAQNMQIVKETCKNPYLIFMNKNLICCK